MKNEIHRLISKFSLCIGISTNQITPEFKTLHFWEVKSIYSSNPNNVKFIKPKMFNVKPQPFSVQVKDKRKKK